MSLVFYKSLLSLLILFLAIVAIFTMFEIMGKEKPRFNIQRLRTIHMINGILFFLFCLIISYSCITFIIRSEAELSPRGTFHSIFAITVLVLFNAKCSFCHNAHSTETIVGPGLKGILKGKKLPVSKRPATPENVRNQLIKPFAQMPSFEYLKEGEIEDIISFLDTFIKKKMK